MLDELQPPANNPLRQITDAFLALRNTRVRQDLLLVRYATSLALCDIHFRYLGQLDSSICGDIRDTMTLLGTSLYEIVPEALGAVQIMEANVTLFTSQLDFSITSVRKDGLMFLQNVVDMLDNVYEVAERLQTFRSHVVSLGEIEEVDAKEQARVLLETIDDTLALSNRYWFCCKDMEANLKAALV